jgi:hypothetical protein
LAIRSSNESSRRVLFNQIGVEIGSLISQLWEPVGCKNRLNWRRQQPEKLWEAVLSDQQASGRQPLKTIEIILNCRVNY